MPERHVDHLLIGGGIASASAARALREKGADGTIAVVGRELDAPYHRPPLTKEYLRGEASREDGLVLDAGWWAEHDVDLLTRTSAMSLDPVARTVALSTKEEWSYGQALVATGAMVRRLNVDGSQHDGIHYVRAPGNADAIRADAEGRSTALVVGGSYLACEVAASLTELGLQVTMVMQEAEPHERGFGLRVGRWVRGVLEAKGVTVHGADEIARFTAAGDRVAGAVTGGELDVAADLVVCGVGAMPDVMFARKSGLELGESGGIRCDAQLRTATSRDVFAAGDVCEYASVVHGRPIRAEHEVHAESQGAFVAAAMLGATEPYREIPYFFSDIADWISLEYVGPAAGWDREVVRGSIDDGEFSVFYLRDGVVQGALSVGRGADLDRARELMTSGERVADDAI